MQESNIKSAELNQVARELRGELEKLYDAREAEAMSRLILEHLTGLPYHRIVVDRGNRLAAEQRQKLKQLLEELLTGKPVQYVLGEAHFYGLSLRVNPSVLIPRQETEELVDWILKSVHSGLGERELRNPITILDIGTGSGCIAIALEKNLSAAKANCSVGACDLSIDALELARENARINRSDVRFWQADILDENSWEAFPILDLIVSNPPYVTHSEQALMQAHVLKHEPHLALFVPDNDPLLFYRKVAAFGRQKLRPGGYLFFEINEAFGRDVCEHLEKTGYAQVELRKDLPGKDRMVRALQVHSL